MKLLVVSNFSDIPQEHYLLNLLFCEGLEFFHLRKKNYTLTQMEKYLQKIPAVFHPRIVLHSHLELLRDYPLKGAHFTKKFSHHDYLKVNPTLTLEDLNAVLGQLSFSVHSIPEMKSLEPLFDYIFLSPVFDSISNQGYNSKFRAHDLKMFLQSVIPRPEVIALGGMTDDKVAKAAELGFDGVALLGHIWTIFENDQDLAGAVKRFNGIQALIRQHSYSNFS